MIGTIEDGSSPTVPFVPKFKNSISGVWSGRDTYINISIGNGDHESLPAQKNKTQFNREWNIPSPARFFTGRKDCIDHIKKNLIENRCGCAVLSQVLAGQGGVGKSQIAFAYAKEAKNTYNNRGWLIETETSTLLLNSCIELIIALRLYEGLGISGDEKEIENVRVQLFRLGSKLLSYLISRLPSFDKMLFVFDNVDDKSLVEPFLTDEMLMAHDILITSHISDWGSFPVEQINVFSPEYSRQYIQRVLKEQYKYVVGDQDADSLGELLGRLPLALSQAVYTIRNSMTIADYIGQYHECTNERKILLNSPVFAQDKYKKTVFTTWDISRKQVAKQSTAANDIYELCSLFGADIIPKALFEDGICGTTGQARYTFQVLADHSLAQHTDGDKPKDSISIHRLQQEVVRIHLIESKMITNKLEQAANILIEKFSYNGMHDQMARYRLYIPHITSVLKFSEALGITGNNHFVLNYRIGAYFSKQGDFSLANRFFGSALSIYKGGLPDLSVALFREFLSKLGLFTIFGNYSKENDLILMESEYEKVKKIPDRDLTEYDILLIDALGSVRRSMQNYDGALELFLKVINQDHVKINKERLAVCYMNLASIIYLRDKNYEKSLHYYDIAEKVFKEKYNGKHPYVCLFFCIRGECHLREGYLDKAKEDFELSLNYFGDGLKLLLHGLLSIYLCRSYIGMAEVYFQYAEKTEENEILLNQALSYANEADMIYVNLTFNKDQKPTAVLPDYQKLNELKEKILKSIQKPSFCKF